MTEADYPYVGDGAHACKYEDTKRIAQVENVRGVGDARVDLANGPVVAAIQAQGEVLQYQSGIYNGYCGDQPNHFVAIVGWGRTSQGIEYWIARNSWGTAWGEQGHIRIQIDGNCSVFFDSYPDMV